MDKEYCIKCSREAIAEFDRFIRSSGFFKSYDETCKMYDLSLSEGETEWPDAYAELGKTGIYFFDTLTTKFEVAHIFRRIVDHALKHSDVVEIVEI